MKRSSSLAALASLVGVLALIQAGVGLFWQAPGSPYPFTPLHGSEVQMFGSGIYRDNPAFNAPILIGTDAITLFIGIPLLLVSIILYWRGSLRGGVLLAGVLSYLLYVAASLAFGAAYNNLFLVYVCLFSSSLFAFIQVFSVIDLQNLQGRLSDGAPRRGIAILLFLSGAALLLAWLGDIVGPLLRGGFPNLKSYTTEVTYVIDLGVIVPAVFLAGGMLLRRAPMGNLLGAIFIILLALIGLMVAAQTVSQLLSGITLGVGEFIGKAGTFMLLALVSLGLLVRMFRSIQED